LTESRGAPASRKELREFGLIVGGLLAAIFGLALPLLKHHAIPLWPWIVGLVLAVPALLFPPALRGPHFLWMKLGLVLGWINQRIILTIIFYIIVLPTGLIMRAMGRDPMARGFEPERESYRVPSRKAPARSMDRPF
jgi:Saxitoxin biosynthesis operon protein SxtJ